MFSYRKELLLVYKTYRVKLLPNNKQQSRFFEYAGAARYVYNWVLDREKEQYEIDKIFISAISLQREYTQLKQQEDKKWLQDINRPVAKQAIKDACGAYEKFFKGKSKYPKKKTKKRTIPSFYQDTAKIEITDTHVKIALVTGKGKAKSKHAQKICQVKLARKGYIPFGDDIKYYNPKVKYDGMNWWLTVGVKVQESANKPTNVGIGIDLGIKNLAICSDGYTYQNINKTETVRKLEKRKKRIQRSLSRKYEMNKVGNKYVKTNNIKRQEKQLLKLNHRLSNIRYNYLHQVTTDIIKREPSFIVLEDLNVRGMMKNKHLARSLQEQGFSIFRHMIKYKAERNNIKVVIADRYYPSSKLCNCCGYKKVDLKLKDRIFECPNCGYENDRDLNAALNLRDYK